MKKICALICVVMVILSIISTSALAVVPDEKIVDLGDGFYMIETISQSFTGQSRSGGEIQGSKTGRVYSGSVLIGIATLSASFDISGSTAKATAANISGDGYNNGSYSGGNADCYGSKASGTAYFTYNGVEKYVKISISCSPGGSLT